MTDEKYMLAYSADIEIELFRKSLKFPILRKVNCAKLEDIAKAKAKIEVLDDDDEIKLKYVPGEDDGTGSFIDVIYSGRFLCPDANRN